MGCVLYEEDVVSKTKSFGHCLRSHLLIDRLPVAFPHPLLQIVRGGIFGGQLPHIECVLKVRGHYCFTL